MEGIDKVNNSGSVEITVDGYTDISDKVIIKDFEKENGIRYLLKKENYTLNKCKEECNATEDCAWLQYLDKNCYLFSYEYEINKIFQWKISEYSLQEQIISLKNVSPLKKEGLNSGDCHENCISDSHCIYSIYDEITEVCDLYYSQDKKGATLSFSNEKLITPTPIKKELYNNETVNNRDNGNDDPQYGINTRISTFTLYGLTVIILVLIAIILCICKKRSENEKMLLYTLSNVTANSQSRSRSKSSPSENMSYLNNTNLSTSYFQNINASSITINPESYENTKLLKNYSGTNFKKSSRKSISSKAPSIHSVSTLCTCNSNNNLNSLNNNGLSTDLNLNEKGHHNLSLSTKKSQYNYSIKTFSAKDPTGLSQNIKSLFANSYNVNGFDTNSYNDNCSMYNNPSIISSPKVEQHDTISHKDLNSSNIINMNGHKKQPSSISINIPKVGSSASIPKNTINGNVASIATQPQSKVVKLKKHIHSKQFTISPEFSSEPNTPINSINSTNSTDDYVQIHSDVIDSVNFADSRENLLFNTDNTSTNVSTVSVTKVK